MRFILNIRSVYILTIVFVVSGVWWGWPTSFDQHDPTPRALKMLWNRSLDPVIRYWGAFGYQEILLFSVLPVTILKKIGGLSAEFTEPFMYLLTRMLWALKGFLIVVMGYHTSIRLFQDKIAALACAWAIALATGFIAWVHIPQVDIVHAFWYSAALMFTVFGWQRCRLRYFYLAAVFAGFAAGVKYVGGIVVLAPMAGVMLMQYRSLSKVVHSILIGATALVIFTMTTPIATGSPVEWLPGYLADVLANMNREVEKPFAFWTMPGAIWDMFGPATSLLSLFSLFCWLGTRRGNSNWKQWLIMILAIFPYYLVVGTQHVTTVRYVVPIIVPLAIIIGYAVARTLELKSIRQYYAGFIGVTFVVQTALALALCTGLMTDSRYELAQWLEANTSTGDKVETTLNHRPYFVAQHDFEEIGRPHFQPESYSMHKAMMEDKDSFARRMFDWSVEIAGYDPAERPTWVERERIWLTERGQNFDTSPSGVSTRGSRYIVINRNTAHHYILDWPGIDPASPKEREFFQTVLDEASPFEKVARFESIVPPWLRYPNELWRNISPTIEVFEVTQ